MAEFIRPVKPDDWTQYELDHFGIEIKPLDKQEFFGSANLPQAIPVIPSLAGFMTNEDREHAVDGDTMKLLHYLDLVLDPQVGQEAAAYNFAAKLLEKLGYDDGDRIIFTRLALPIVMSGVSYMAQTDVCVMDKDDMVLLILLHDDKQVPRLKDPESQVIALAIAAFTANNKVRETSLNLPPLPATSISAITMIGTNPIFYVIVVTSELRTAVQEGSRGGARTHVFRHVPVLPKRHGLGMRALENRVEILACLDAFRQTV